MKNIKFSRFISWQILNNLVYIVDERNRQLYLLDNFGKDTWLSIAETSNIDEIIDKLDEIYISSAKDSISVIVVQFIDNLREKGFVYEC